MPKSARDSVAHLRLESNCDVESESESELETEYKNNWPIFFVFCFAPVKNLISSTREHPVKPVKMEVGAVVCGPKAVVNSSVCSTSFA